MAFGRSIFYHLQTKETRCGILASLKTPNKIQPGEYSKGSGQDDMLRAYGQLCYLYLNENASKRNLNVNRNNLDNNWNANVRFLAVCEYLLK